MRRRATAPKAPSFGPAGLFPPGPAAAAGGQQGRMLGLNQAIGNQAMGALLGAGGPVAGAAPAGPSLLGGTIPPPQLFRHGSGGVSLTVYFGKDHFFLDGRNLAAVQALAEELRIMVEPTIVVDGHASAEGDAAYNTTLSAQRRDLVIALLAKDREPRPTFGGTAHGEDAPAVAESGSGEALELSRAQNRRVEILVTPKPTAAAPAKPERRIPHPSELPGILGPETPEERINRMLREGPIVPPQRERKSLQDLADEKLDDFLDGALKRVGVKDPKKRDFVRPLLRNAIKKGAEKALDEALDRSGLDSEYQDAIKNVIDAASQQKL